MSVKIKINRYLTDHKITAYLAVALLPDWYLEKSPEAEQHYFVEHPKSKIPHIYRKSPDDTSSPSGKYNAFDEPQIVEEPKHHLMQPITEKDWEKEGWSHSKEEEFQKRLLESPLPPEGFHDELPKVEGFDITKQKLTDSGELIMYYGTTSLSAANIARKGIDASTIGRKQSFTSELHFAKWSAQMQADRLTQQGIPAIPIIFELNIPLSNIEGIYADPNFSFAKSNDQPISFISSSQILPQWVKSKITPKQREVWQAIANLKLEDHKLSHA